MKSDDLRERLEESEKLMNEMEKTWEDKLKETERIHMVKYPLSFNFFCFFHTFETIETKVFIVLVRIMKEYG